MEPFYQDNHRTLYNGDCRSMPELADESVQMVVTSPPYWGLRKYTGAQDLIWGSDKNCRHEWVTEKVVAETFNRVGHVQDFRQEQPHRSTHPEMWQKVEHLRGFCSLCGDWQGAYGLEPTPELYVQHTIEILREIRRVLRKDGVVFWNIGDSYGSGKGTCFNPGGGKGSFSGHGDRKDAGAYPLDRGNVSMLKASGLKPKDLCLIPFRVAIAAQEAGWWVRSVIIWNKPNPMPESVRDRPTESHEYILMLTKSARYYWDAEAVREAQCQSTLNHAPRKTRTLKGEDEELVKPTFGENMAIEGGRNLRSVWSFPTQPYPGAHFATFPEKLPELCIKAATPEAGCCAKCGMPWLREIERTGHINKRELAYAPNNCPTKTDSTGWAPLTRATDNWQPSCKCNTDKPPVPALVLDPFAGSGTTLKVAAELNRQAVGYELSGEYCKLIVERNKQTVLV